MGHSDTLFRLVPQASLKFVDVGRYRSLFVGYGSHRDSRTLLWASVPASKLVVFRRTSVPDNSRCCVPIHRDPFDRTLTPDAKSQRHDPIPR